MINKRAASFKAETLSVFLLFVSSGEAELSGFVVSDLSVFNPLPDINYLQDPTSGELKKRIVSALKTLSIDGKESCLVQYWAATNAGKTHLLATTDQPFGIHGTNEELKLYHKACLHHKLYVHREGKISFGLPGQAFKDRTPHQTQHVHDYPEDQRPPCEVKAIFTKKWGSFAVPVILANECIGVLEFVDTEPKRIYDGDINEVNKALKCAGFESFNIRHTKKDTHIPSKRQRNTNSSMYNHYNVLVPYFGLSKAKAMEKVDRKFFPREQTKTTREATHIPDYSPGKAKKVEKEFKVIESTFTSAIRNVGITVWPFIRKITAKASESSLERTTITNTSALETQNDQIISCSTSNTEAFPESKYACPTFLPEDTRFECQDHETTYLDAPGTPVLSESQTAQTVCNETSSIGIPDNAGDLNCGWEKDLDHNLCLDQEARDFYETGTDQTLLDTTSFFGSLIADDLTYILVQGEASERPLKRTTINNISSLETQNDLIISCITSHTIAFPESGYARPNFLPEDTRFECQDHETTYLDAPGTPDLSESQTAQTVCDKTSSIGIPESPDNLNCGWDKDLDHNLCLDQEASDFYETGTNQTLLETTSFFGSLIADDLTYCLVQGEASESSMERTTVTNTSALETQNDQIISCSTRNTEAFPESEYARPNFMPEGTRFECQDHETTYRDAPGTPDLSESQTAQTVCDKTSSIGIPDNAGDLNCGWDKDLDHNLFLDQEARDLYETGTDQTLLDTIRVQGEASESSMERTTITNTSALETQNDQIISCSTCNTEALPESEYACPSFLSKDNRFECQDHDSRYLNAPETPDLSESRTDVYIFPHQETPDLSESRTDQILNDKTSSTGIPDNAGDFNSSWDNGVDDGPFVIELIT